MEMVCFIFGPMLASQPCAQAFLGFDIPTSSFIFIENVFYYSFSNSNDIYMSMSR